MKTVKNICAGIIIAIACPFILIGLIGTLLIECAAWVSPDARF